MGFYNSIWSNFKNTIKTVGSNINRYLPYVLGGIYKVSKFLENNGIVDAIKVPSGMIANLSQQALKLHQYFDPSHPYYGAEPNGAFVPTVDDQPSVDQPAV